MIEVIIKDNEIQIYVNRKGLAEWLAGKGDVPWDGDPNSTSDQDEVESTKSEATDEKKDGYRDARGEKKDFPNPVDGGDDTSGAHVADRDIGEEPDSINLFDKGPNDIGGTLQDDSKAKEKMKAMKDWLKSEKFNYKNFCRYLYQLTEVAGFKLSTPLIGLTQKKEPTLFQLATRYYSYWLSSKDYIAGDYKTFLLAQLADMGITIQMVKDEFNGEEIDPTNLPKALAVTK